MRLKYNLIVVVFCGGKDCKSSPGLENHILGMELGRVYDVNLLQHGAITITNSASGRERLFEAFPFPSTGHTQNGT